MKRYFLCFEPLIRVTYRGIFLLVSLFSLEKGSENLRSMKVRSDLAQPTNSAY